MFGFLHERPEVAAPRLLGHWVTTHDGISLRIVEVEAYAGPGQDDASHAGRGRTRRNAAMFGPPGHLYVYLSYGVHRCLNIVAHESGAAGGVLLRAAQVSGNVDLARHRRGAAAGPDHRLASGPGRLGQVTGVSLAASGTPLDGTGLLQLQETTAPVGPISYGRRIGISRDTDRPWRWWLTGDPSVSVRSGASLTRPDEGPGSVATSP